MITPRKRLAGPRSRSMLLPALLFLCGASVTAFGDSTAVMLCLLPAGLAIAATPRPVGAVRGHD